MGANINETIAAIYKNNPTMADDLVHTLNVIANLMFELGNRKTGAKYFRIFHHKNLSVRIDFNNEE